MQTRSYRRFGLRQFLFNLPLAILGGLGFALMWSGWDKRSVSFWLGVGLFALGILGMLIIESWRMRRFRCPECRAHLPKPESRDLAPGDPIVFRCEVCQIEWCTGLVVSED